MRLFIAICFDENMLDSLNEIQDDLTRSESMLYYGLGTEDEES